MNTAVAGFNGLVDLAASLIGGKALATSDDFFAGMDNLLLPGRAIFIPGKYSERGKWMDGWESRRKRVPGHDWCLLELGVPGSLLAFDIDTQHFIGNHPAFASVEGIFAARGTPLPELLSGSFHELLPQVPLLPNAQNLSVASPGPVVSHLRLNIFPDGGVARFRAYGQVSAVWAAPELDALAAAHVPPGCFNLAALENGAVALACSDAHFGGMSNLLLPGRAENMGSGWETRRRRGPGSDWIVIRLGARGTPRLLEIDTKHFKGNFPDRCSVEVIDAAGARPTDLIESVAWRPLLAETKLTADTRHFFARELLANSPATHVRLRIFPDGGVSRLRVWGDNRG
ncbi:MAG TPA: allantoicase [Polyangiaceae bacterium]|nr:allantoicase [Polyangiaceae bacterium]